MFIFVVDGSHVSQEIEMKLSSHTGSVGTFANCSTGAELRRVLTFRVTILPHYLFGKTSWFLSLGNICMPTSNCLVWSWANL